MAAVAEWYRYQTVAYLVKSSSPVPLKTRRVGQRCTLNLSGAEMFSRWWGVPAQNACSCIEGGSEYQCRIVQLLENFWGSCANNPKTHSLTRELLVMELVILKHGQVTKTKLELAPSSPNYYTTPMKGRLSLDKINVQWVLLHGFSGTRLEFMILSSRVRDIDH
ncbi:hypothetical protein TNCV_366841 [Trichonephila clavipes]|nr:hypothetical protein TNCV_366841 [Trichonephila clavipes]